MTLFLEKFAPATWLPQPDFADRGNGLFPGVQATVPVLAGNGQRPGVQLNRDFVAHDVSPN